MRKENTETINLDIMDPAPHLTFYFSLLKDDVVKGRREGGGGRGISYLLLSCEESSRQRGRVFFRNILYNYIYESIYRVALKGDWD